MKRLVAMMMALSLTACATCKSTDTPDVCRTKERENGQARNLMPLASEMDTKNSSPEASVGGEY